MCSLNTKLLIPTKIAWDLGDTLVRIKSKKLQEGAARASIALGFPLSKHQIEDEIKSEWRLRKDKRHLNVICQIDSDKKEYDYWMDDFYLNLFRRITGKSTIPSSLLKYFCNLQIEPDNFELIPYARAVMDVLQSAGIKQGLISNAFPSANRIIKYHKLDKSLKFMILSYECKLVKPDPEIYQLLEENFDLSDREEIIYVDDRLEFLNIPRYLRIQPVWLNNDLYSQSDWAGTSVNSHRELLKLFFLSCNTNLLKPQVALQNSLI